MTIRGSLCGWLAALTLAAGASASPVDPQVSEALSAAPPGALLAVEVLLAGDEALPPLGPARRAEVAEVQDEVLAALPPGAWTLVYQYESVPGLALRASAAAVEALASHPDVQRVSLDGVLHATLDQGRALIGANSVHGDGGSGAGVTVAVLDTGVDTDHPDLSDDLVAQRCFCTGCCPGGAGSAEDDEGHGTSVAGIVTSSGAQAADGVAPDAHLIGVKVLGATGSGNFSDTAAALDWLLTNHTSGGPLVVNLSLGDGGEYATSSQGSCDNSTTASAIAALHAAGVPVIVASGNEGHDGGISFPACVAEAISVGGVYDASVGTVGWCGQIPLCLIPECSDSTGADVFVCHSNSGAILDVLAPDYRTRTSAMGGGVNSSFGGTSAASPYTAGEAALLLEVDPSLTPEQVRTLLTGHGPMVSNPDNGQSYRRTDIDAAVQALPEPDVAALGAIGVAAVGLLARLRPRPASSARPADSPAAPEGSGTTQG